MEQPIDIIRAIVQRFAVTPRYETLIPGLTLFRTTAPTSPVLSVYEPRLCVVVQGRKRVQLGEGLHEVTAGRCFLTTVELPVTAYVSEASPNAPHLALTLAMNRMTIAELLLHEGTLDHTSRAPAGLAVDGTPDSVLAPLARLLSLLDDPKDAAILASMAEREIWYRMLRSNLGSLLAAHARPETHLSRIRDAATWIRRHHAKPMRIDDLAARVGMSVTSFHRHFKAVTYMSPVRYRTEIRLREARRLLLLGEEGVGQIGFSVGYDSPSQFSRDYRRTFGRAPTEDASVLGRLADHS